MPKDLNTLKERVKTEYNRLSNELRKAVLSMKKRATLCVKVKGKAIEGKKLFKFIDIIFLILIFS